MSPAISERLCRTLARMDCGRGSGWSNGYITLAMSPVCHLCVTCVSPVSPVSLVLLLLSFVSLVSFVSLESFVSTVSLGSSVSIM